jgi:retron-type reverse transcriptase
MFQQTGFQRPLNNYDFPMDRKRIAELASQMKTKEDLLALLNLIKRAELEEIGLQDLFYPFTMKHINYYCNPNNAFHRYRQFKVKKKSGGFRLITTPRNKSFMMMLSSVNVLLKSIYIPSDFAMGFTEGRSVVTNAAVHKGQNYVFNIDLKDFFPSIDQARVWKRLQLKPFNFSIQIASLIAGLCAMRDIRKDEKGNDYYAYVLPQGSPTSPIITNMICDNLDRRLAGVAKRFGLQYTRYADDITFSSMHNVYQNDSMFRKELTRIITDQHFIINEEKTRLQKKGARQEVTGIIVSDKLNVTQKYVRDIRNILYIWDRYGYPSAMAKFLPKYKLEKGHVKKGNPNLINVIDGKLMYLKMVKGEEDSVYQKLHNKFVKLVDKMNKNSVTTAQDVTYIETLPLLEFEKKHSTEVTISMSENSHRYAHFMFGDKKAKASVNKSITPVEEKNKVHLAISLCLDKKGNTFWLVHRQDKVIVPKRTGVDIDELNNDLDSLLNM